MIILVVYVRALLLSLKITTIYKSFADISEHFLALEYIR